MSQDLRLGLIVALYVALGVAGELFLSRAMRRMPSGTRPLQALRYVVTTPLALIGTGLSTLNFAMLLALLSKQDVSLIVPSHAASFLLVALTARWLLKERVPRRRWAGVALITVGVSLVLSSRHDERRSRAPRPAAEATASNRQ